MAAAQSGGMVRIKHRYLVCSLHLDAEGGGDISERHIHHAVRVRPAPDPLLARFC